MDIDKLNVDLFTGAEDEEVINCEGGPCNFVIKTDDMNK